MRSPFFFVAALFIMISACMPPGAGGSVLYITQTRDGCVQSDDFNDGILDTSSNENDLKKWFPLLADSSLSFRETNGYFQVYGNTGPVVTGQHKGIVTNYLALNNWEGASLESLEMVSVVEMRNLDPVSTALTLTGDTTVARMTNHLCSNCYQSGFDNNSTVSVGYLEGTADGPGWDPPGGKWGFRCKYDIWANRYLSANDSLFGDEAATYYPTMVDMWGFDAGDSTLTTGYVYHNDTWIPLGSHKNYMGTCRKTELKSMAKWARNHDIDYRWDNYRMFLNSWKWPVRFTLLDIDTLPMAGNYVLELRAGNPIDYVVRDTLDGASEFSIYLDHTEMVIPETVKLVLYSSYTDSVAVALLPATGVQGCYPDDAYEIIFDSLGTIATGVVPHADAEPGRLTIDNSYPNPFRGATTIRFSAPPHSPVSLSIHDIRGRRVATLFDRRVSTGNENTAVWRGTDDAGRKVASGVYFVRLRSEEAEDVRKVILRR